MERRVKVVDQEEVVLNEFSLFSGITKGDHIIAVLSSQCQGFIL